MPRKASHSPRSLCGAILAIAALSSPLAAQVTQTLVAAPGTVQLEPGRQASGWFYNDQLPGPIIRAVEGQRVQVRFVNNLPEESTIHWHGLPVPLGMDGVPGVTRPPVEPGQEFTYEFDAEPAGTYFFHPHVGLQLDRGLYGVLLVDAPGTPSQPFDREYVLVLDDWLAGAPVPRRDPLYSTWLINGKTSLGQSPLVVQPGQRVKLRFINASTATNFVVAVDGHPMTVTHTDGQAVQPVQIEALPIGIGERYDVIITASNSGAWSIAAADLGNRNRTLVRAVLRYLGSPQADPSPSYVPPALAGAPLLRYSQLAAAGVVRPISSQPDRTHALTLSGGMMGSYVWTINGQVWPNASPLPVRYGENVRMTMRNMSFQPHPMHLHGHFFRLLGTAGGNVAPVVKDTVLVGAGMMSGLTSVEFFADNPGNWMFHCHNLYHAEAGMMRLVQYVGSDHDFDGVPDGEDFDPLSAYPVLSTVDLGGGYRIGRSFSIDLQWPAGESALFLLGLSLSPSLPLGELGDLRIWPALPLASAVAGGNGIASFALAVPPDPVLAGTISTLQAVASHATLSPGWRLSTAARVHLY